MYLVKTDNVYVFLKHDPSSDGYDGPFAADVSLDESDVRHCWPDGGARPCVKLGRSRDSPGVYRVFGDTEALAKAGFEHIDIDFVTHDHWTEFPESIARGELGTHS